MNWKAFCWKLMYVLATVFRWITVVIGGIFYTIGSTISGTVEYVGEVKKEDGEFKRIIG